ncbi:hypothetical protein HD553DRAFT_344391 [Filobasidium floriforme]|uniref:uncharacterized protein n=1 Tax=Filobasidium floriforme TaxID=5210 RepID=UPI001E8DFB93|nr:uncharacterized protein HD553DRAFT_344391 [Filobasidium floriforme]KAH8081176.1 hypothetical protein HD553DRAFT_344391 [Filobasidium floriforme]
MPSSSSSNNSNPFAPRTGTPASRTTGSPRFFQRLLNTPLVPYRLSRSLSRSPSPNPNPANPPAAVTPVPAMGDRRFGRPRSPEPPVRDDDGLYRIPVEERENFDEFRRLQEAERNFDAAFELRALLKWPRDLDNFELEIKVHPFHFQTFDHWKVSYKKAVKLSKEAQEAARVGDRAPTSPSKNVRRFLKANPAEPPGPPTLGNDPKIPLGRTTTGAYIGCVFTTVDKGGKDQGPTKRDDATIARLIADEDELPPLPREVPHAMLANLLRPTRAGTIKTGLVNDWLKNYQGGWRLSCVACKMAYPNNEPPIYQGPDQRIDPDADSSFTRHHLPLIHCVKYGQVYLCRGVIGSTKESDNAAPSVGNCGSCQGSKGGCRPLDVLKPDAATDARIHPMVRILNILSVIATMGQMNKETRQIYVDRIVTILQHENCHARFDEKGHKMVEHPEFFPDEDDEQE